MKKDKERSKGRYKGVGNKVTTGQKGSLCKEGGIWEETK